ncbi:hypothetical protein HYH02_011681 [Chlamydomonas schloesseri]|uniref:PPIase cyclophilin-type domain-containing protein n=1 Tax=Chlamydomonas schloesseri TaxID=2026947 RepID=A0A835SZ32_9CHLO|nr:hypothetical protein HYH02_011681 [Chlamydomonas schloesseri]|eukprot:KAG2435967.1 hypothetical protein HYH02_011681 [Chlamydomonas schloesseri]
MGKGGTRFVGDSVSVRAGKKSSGTSAREIRKNIDKFLETGMHPELERMRQEHTLQIPALPDLDINRPFVFMDISVANKPLGRLVFELFEDHVPQAVTHFRNRCMPGSSAGLAGTSFHKLLPRFALYGGRSPRASDGVRLPSNHHIRAVEGGLVAVGLDGEDVVLILDRALALDSTHQVVGRVHQGRELLDKIGDLRTLAPDDAPAQRITITRCGPTDRHGNHESLEDAAGGSGAAGAAARAANAAARLAEASAEARSSVLDALSEGLKRKRKPAASAAAASDSDDSDSDEDEEEEGGKAAKQKKREGTAEVEAAGPSGSAPAGAAAGGAGGGAAAAAAAGGPKDAAAKAAAAARNVKARMLDSMLGDLGGSDEDDSDSSSSGGSEQG